MYLHCVHIGRLCIFMYPGSHPMERRQPATLSSLRRGTKAVKTPDF
jgi:hypothetical protein